MHANIYTTVPLSYIKCNGYDFYDTREQAERLQNAFSVNSLVNKGFCGFTGKDPTTKRIW